MKKLRIAKIVGATLALAMAICISGNSNAHAAEITWTGGGGTDHSWNSTSNWEGGVVPTKDDTIVFDASKMDEDDSGSARVYVTGNVDAGSIVVKNDASVEIATFGADATMTVYGDIDASASKSTLLFDTYSSDTNTTANLTVKLGADITITNTRFGNFASSSYGVATLDINGSTVTLKDSVWVGYGGTQVADFAATKLTGAGVINIVNDALGNDSSVLNSLTTISATSDFSGVINIEEAAVLVVNSIDGLGSADVNINKGRLQLYYSAYRDDDLSSLKGLNITNAITVNGMYNDSDPNIYITTPVLDDGIEWPTIKLSKVTLNSNAGLATLEAYIDLAGIVDNGYCITYFNNSQKYILNGPTQCSANGGSSTTNDSSSSDNGSDSSYPGAPSTGLAKLASPLAALVAGIVAVAAVLAIRKRKTANK